VETGLGSGVVLDLNRLVGWYEANARDLPWRRPGTTPWGVLVSEVMLQQTQVVRVVPVWPAWMRRWPRPSALAAEPASEVLRAWGKLGYPRRALRLHECAQVLSTVHGDSVPSEVDALRALPGVGVYTAHAVAAFAFGARCAVMDTNVRRVVARAVHGAEHSATGLSDVDGLLPAQPARAARASVALMELGALLCTARRPRCGQCPLRGGCAWSQRGRPSYDGRSRRSQRFAGTDRQVRGLLMAALRGTVDPVPRSRLDLVWADRAQRDRCLDSLLLDGLVEQTGDGQFALPGEH
jgi:A/G-specific adenine glycosylase